MGETVYKSNSHKSRETEEKKVESVVRGEVKVKKEPVSRKFSDVFLNDTVDNVKSYLIFDVLVPAIKDTIVELISNGASMLAYGNPSARRSTNNHGAKSSYTTYYRGGSSSSSRERDDRRASVRRDRHSYDDVIFNNRGDAMEVKECIMEIIDNYHMVSIADYYELAGIQGNYTDSNYGWYEIDDIPITRDRDGYRLKLPKPVAFD